MKTIDKQLAQLQNVANAEQIGDIKNVKNLRKALNHLRYRQVYVEPKLSKEIGSMIENSTQTTEVGVNENVKSGKFGKIYLQPKISVNLNWLMKQCTYRNGFQQEFLN